MTPSPAPPPSCGPYSRIVSTPPDGRGPASPAGGVIEDVVEAVKPKLRGWLHLGMAPLATILGLLLVVMAPTRGLRLAAAIYTLTAALLFATSAVYHRGSWSRRQDAVLRRLDHANIFLIIAGSYTPFAVLLPRGPAAILLTIVWAGALVGVLFRILWMDAPRWLYVPSYAALGLVAVFFVPLMREHLGVPTLTLVVVGGVLYILGAVVYGLRRPDPSPRWFGYHEIFHTLTILAFLTHYVAASLALY